MYLVLKQNEAVPLHGIISLFKLQIRLAHVITLTWAIMKNFLLSVGFVFNKFSESSATLDSGPKANYWIHGLRQN